MIPLNIRLEIYAGVLVLMAVCCVGSYFKGRGDESDANHKTVLANNARAMTDYQAAALLRDQADEASRGRALAFVDDVSKRMDSVNAKLSKLPPIVVDARGCDRLTDAAGVRWNNVELVPAGQALDPPGDAVGPVQPAGVPRAK